MLLKLIKSSIKYKFKVELSCNEFIMIKNNLATSKGEQ